MADDSEMIKDVFNFDPCGTPRGMLYYNLTELTGPQQMQLNDQKLDIIRENQQYLNEHPEIKVVTTMILKAILRERPKVAVQEFLAKYLMQSWPDIKKEIDRCIAEKERKDAMNKVMPSATSILIGLQEESFEMGAEEEWSEESSLLQIQKHNQILCKSILDDIVDRFADAVLPSIDNVKQSDHRSIDFSSDLFIIPPTESHSSGQSEFDYGGEYHNEQ